MRSIISLLLILILSSCNNELDLKNNFSPSIKVINESSTSSNKINSWINYASQKMSNQNANILSVSWNVGDFVNEGGFDRPFNTNEVIISEDKIENILSEISNWLDETCLNSNQKKRELKNYRNYLEKGADASTQIDLCPNYRLLLMAFTPHMEEDEYTGEQGFVIHELYHAFQHDLSNESCRRKRDKSDSNGTWLVEGAASYFSSIVVGEMNNYNGVNNLLKLVYNAYREDNSKSIYGSDMANRSAAGIRLMIERGWLNESEILDGSFFHNCKSEQEWSKDNPNASKIKNLWYLIEEKDGKYVFTEEALEG